jgi:hypothetical protein
MRSFITLRGVSMLAVATVGAATAALPSAVQAQSTPYTRPNVSTAATATTATLNGVTFTNQGIVGAGRLDANTRDFRGETLGSFSGMALDLSQWSRNADGSYNGAMTTLPDRGPFDGAIDYRNRIHTSNLAFRPLTGTAALPQVPASQSQLTITPTGGLTLKDALGVEMTGRDPGANTVTRDGIVYPVATDGSAAGRVALDAEGIAFLPDGSFWVSDEYAAGLYHFDATGRQIGAIQTVPALLPRTAGAINFNSTAAGQTGRRNNQGLEAMTITPDNRKLLTILQSATVQDTNGANQQTRNNTRILVYDIAGTASPTNPVGHYVLQLPVFTNNGNGAAVNRTAAQSEMLALNDTQFLVLARDGLGRGVAANTSTSTTPVYKSVLLVDISQATNLAGTAYETGNTPVATNGTLASGITAVQQIELVNMLNPVQLGRVGMNLTRLPLSGLTTLGEKQEAMALAPVLEEGAPQDFFLFIGNDNDFQGTDISFNGVSYEDGAGDDTGNNDSVMLVYRLTLPTYVDPMALAALQQTAPDVLYGTRIALNGVAATITRPAMRYMGTQRRWAGEDDGQNVHLWIDGGYDQHPDGATTQTALNGYTRTATVGLDAKIAGALRIGIHGGYRALEASTNGAALDGDGWSLGGYAAVTLPAGLYLEAAGGYLGRFTYSAGRVSAYRQVGTGRTGAEGWAGSGELGWTVPVGGFSLSPFAGIDYNKIETEGYTEKGASVSNLTFADRSFERFTYTVGGEVAADMGAFRPSLRGGYAIEDERGDSTAVVSLASAMHAMGTQTLALGQTERDAAFAEARLAMRAGPITAVMTGGGRWGRGDDQITASVGLTYGF